ncbi:MAG: 5-deoxy-glucuronate isomerase [Chloroflexota bacterium]|nr:5-deoxy-glucuronate isomerase [Chloroflexota bacterium]
MSRLIRRPDVTGNFALTPKDAGWQYIGFETRWLDAGEETAIDLASREFAVIPLSGTIDVETKDGGSWSAIGSRDDVFAAPPDGLYLPAGGRAAIRATRRSQIALCFAASDRSGESKPINAESTVIETRGVGNATRYIRHVVPPEFTAHRLLVVEVLTPNGNWSSYPPHKHDTDSPDEAELEEIYYHRQSPADGFAFQRVYTDDRSLDETMTVHDQDVVVVPRGYHVVAQAHGYDGYYLNVLAGDRRSMAASDDAPHRWIRDRWAAR